MICSRCIYDDSIPYIEFDHDGVCNYCRQYDQMEKEYPTGDDGWKILQALAGKIKKSGRGRKYDVVVGVSGGCDSSYLVHLAKELGLRPLAAHFDNTWNSKTAVENIQNVLQAMKVDLFTHVVDNREICDIYKSFMKASVPEFDTPADIGLATTHYLAAAKYGIKYIFEGHSFRTEGISPHGWVYMDARYIQDIQKRFGTIKIKTFPNLWMSRWLKWMIINRIKKIRPLYYLDYNKDEVKKMLTERYGWKWYGGHHMENRTAYYVNNYHWPNKFGIDSRYIEFSALVRAGQMSREEALEEIKKPYPFDPGILEEILKRLNLSKGEFENLWNLPKKSYRDYNTYKKTFERLRPFFWILMKMDMVPYSFYNKFTRRYHDGH